MTQLLAAAWLLQKTLNIAGLAAALAGVATFGWHFIRINASAAHGETDEVPPESWRGRGAKFGLLILASGVVLTLASMVFAAMLPGEY
jgi:hypothetical protein